MGKEQNDSRAFVDGGVPVYEIRTHDVYHIQPEQRNQFAYCALLSAAAEALTRLWDGKKRKV